MYVEFLDPAYSLVLYHDYFLPFTNIIWKHDFHGFNILARDDTIVYSVISLLDWKVVSDFFLCTML